MFSGLAEYYRVSITGRDFELRSKEAVLVKLSYTKLFNPTASAQTQAAKYRIETVGVWHPKVKIYLDQWNTELATVDLAILGWNKLGKMNLNGQTYRWKRKGWIQYQLVRQDNLVLLTVTQVLIARTYGLGGRKFGSIEISDALREKKESDWLVPLALYLTPWNSR
jgi:hypothetical protein